MAVLSPCDNNGIGASWQLSPSCATRQERWRGTAINCSQASYFMLLSLYVNVSVVSYETDCCPRSVLIFSIFECTAFTMTVVRVHTFCCFFSHHRPYEWQITIVRSLVLNLLFSIASAVTERFPLLNRKNLNNKSAAVNYQKIPSFRKNFRQYIFGPFNKGREGEEILLCRELCPGPPGNEIKEGSENGVERRKGKRTEGEKGGRKTEVSCIFFLDLGRSPDDVFI